MSLYRHLAGKAELTALMVDAAAGEPPPVAEGPSGWREGLADWAAGLRGLYRRRPWILEVPISGPPPGPKNLGWFEAGLRTTLGTGLRDDDRIGVNLLILGYVRQAVLLEGELLRAPTGPGSATRPRPKTTRASSSGSSRPTASQRCTR
jgi:hypothetical protein